MSTSSKSLNNAFVKIDKIIQEEDKILGKIDNEANFAFDILNNLKIHERNQRYESGYTPIDDMSDEEDDYKTYSLSSSSSSSQYSLVSPASALRSAMASTLRSPTPSLTLRSPMTTLTQLSPTTSLTLRSPMTSLSLRSPMTTLTQLSPTTSFTNEESASEHMHIIDFKEESQDLRHNLNYLGLVDMWPEDESDDESNESDSSCGSAESAESDDSDYSDYSDDSDDSDGSDDSDDESDDEAFDYLCPLDRMMVDLLEAGQLNFATASLRNEDKDEYE